MAWVSIYVAQNVVDGPSVYLGQRILPCAVLSVHLSVHLSVCGSIPRSCPLSALQWFGQIWFIAPFLMTHGLLSKPPYHGRCTLHIKLLLIHLEEKNVPLNANHLAWYELDRAVYIPIQHASVWTVIVWLLIQLIWMYQLWIKLQQLVSSKTACLILLTNC